MIKTFKHDLALYDRACEALDNLHGDHRARVKDMADKYHENLCKAMNIYEEMHVFNLEIEARRTKIARELSNLLYD